MSRIVYLIGAGASFGKRNEDRSILEGVPVVSEIPEQFILFRDFIASANPLDYESFKFHGLYHRRVSDCEEEKKEMLSDIDNLIVGIRQHATIDTYAKKLYLTGNKREFIRLKSLLCSFFLWSQLQYKPDGRYDAFLANILEERSLSLPSDISIISWNYDSQLELSYRAFNRKEDLPIYEKNIGGEWPNLNSKGKVFKINGSASFVDFSLVSLIQSEERNMPVAYQLVEFYHNTFVDTQAIGVEFKTHLSFAWEDSVNDQKMADCLANTLSDTEQVVVIGYSFPFFNRTTDRWLFCNMPRLKKVYVQDVNTLAVMQSIQAVLPNGLKLEVVPVSNCEQFYLPSEL